MIFCGTGIRNIFTGCRVSKKCKLKINIKSRQDIIDNIENIRIYVRGHNLFDIFYGKYKKNENEILTKYIQEAREVFLRIFLIR